MAYGLRTYDSSGNVTLEISDSTPRLIAVTAVTVPSSVGTTSTVTVPSVATPANASVVLDSGASGSVTSAGVVTLSGSSYNGGATIMRLFVADL